MLFLPYLVNPVLHFIFYTADAKERIKEEKDGIVLSPQRRSFGHGCHVSGSSGPLAGPGPGRGIERDNQETQPQRAMPGRRIGSGRIIPRTSRPSLTDADEREPGQRRIERETWDHNRDRDRDRGEYHRHRDYDSRDNRSKLNLFIEVDRKCANLFCPHEVGGPFVLFALVCVQ